MPRLIARKKLFNRAYIAKQSSRIKTKKRKRREETKIQSGVPRNKTTVPGLIYYLVQRWNKTSTDFLDSARGIWTSCIISSSSFCFFFSFSFFLFFSFSLFLCFFTITTPFHFSFFFFSFSSFGFRSFAETRKFVPRR